MNRCHLAVLSVADFSAEEVAGTRATFDAHKSGVQGSTQVSLFALEV